MKSLRHLGSVTSCVDAVLVWVFCWNSEKWEVCCKFEKVACMFVLVLCILGDDLGNTGVLNVVTRTTWPNWYFLPPTGKELVNYITDYLTNIRERRVIPDVQPGYMRKLLPDHAPLEPENWDNIFNDIEKIIMPGVCFCNLPPRFNLAYFLHKMHAMHDILHELLTCHPSMWTASYAAKDFRDILVIELHF